MLHRLVDAGNTVIVIEHNLDVIKTADWIIDMGPEGGAGGGLIIAQGTPEQVAEIDGSHTGRFLKEVLAKAATAQVQLDVLHGAIPSLKDGWCDMEQLGEHALDIQTNGQNGQMDATPTSKQKEQSLKVDVAASCS